MGDDCPHYVKMGTRNTEPTKFYSQDDLCKMCNKAATIHDCDGVRVVWSTRTKVLTYMTPHSCGLCVPHWVHFVLGEETLTRVEEQDHACVQTEPYIGTTCVLDLSLVRPPPCPPETCLGAHHMNLGPRPA